MNYQQAYDKIIQAYFKDEILPLDAQFCFCGTLCDNSNRWNKDSFGKRHNDFGNYKGPEYVKMERALLDPIKETSFGYRSFEHSPEEYEAALFAGMSAALDVLKEIHRSRGEDVDNIQTPFVKRQLACPTPPNN